MQHWLRNQGLSIVFIFLFFFSWISQVLTGEQVYNEDMKEKGGQTVNLREYFFTGHFFEATFENWESEFLQMALFVVISAWFFQKGSSDSKDPDKEKESLKQKSKELPWPVKKGGLILKLYEHSLSLALFILFLLSFLLHFYGSLKNYNLEQQLQHQPTQSAYQYLFSSKLWFESFQNWQSEFLSVLALVVLTIYLREKNSPQSKPVESPDNSTGEQS
jgi:membrane protein implicated in regulation of membrane protease activity